MNNLMDVIESRNEQLKKNPFCQWILESTPTSDQAQFGFIPGMLHFILGFKDILTYLEIKNPQTEIDFMINQHCLEDRNHWRWYLQDLQTLGFNEKTWGNNWTEMIHKLWDEPNKPTRDLVYLVIHLIKSHPSAKASLVIIECMESTFGVFMTTLKRRFDQSEIYNKLQFFGQNHAEQEMNHSMGHWIEDSDRIENTNIISPTNLSNIQFNSDELNAYTKMVHQIYDQFETVFKAWLENKVENIEQNKSITNQNKIPQSELSI